MSLAKNIRIKRVYDPPAEEDGVRVLVDRLWPRGLSRDDAKAAYWLKDLAPSNELRKRFHGDPAGWRGFRAAYAKELEQEQARGALAELRRLAGEGPVTLLYASRDETRNNAEALRLFLVEGK